MQHVEHPCSHRCRWAVGLPSRGVACFVTTGISRRPTAAPGRSAAAITCAAASKKSSPGGDSSASQGLAASLLRDAVAALSTSSSSSSGAGLRTGGAATLPEDLRSASYAIAAANTALFFACALVPLLPAATLLLNHRQPHICQLLTSAFAHPSLESLMQCVFFTYVFGRVVERNHGSLATWVVYLTCGAAAAALAWWMLPAKSALLSSAAPAAAWGLFLVGLGLPRLTKKPLEVVCLAPFALTATVSRYSPLAGLLVQDGMALGQLVHLVGASLAAALAAAVLAVVEGWREEQERKQREARRQAEAASQEEALNRVISAATQAAQQLGKKLL
ncbi:hypothetical protein PLESTB_001164600 [Pleodorina starrii]|uniref:Peptidase S54 rhomboid domain-containing protein n=1 Tax=Pleodorina starrii TaxID=330485 RepID=A0A9W6BRA9_9CHLO|nr:hypothetical protein PLESTM_000240300 [Pleodorina starrii]GLC56929.1 hypothetical protein PLESTB_001164600 [Pleodorina starrii]GLC64765.1 hypothetical protein PLESTF_000205000 [Pleodorina starrii]